MPSAVLIPPIPRHVEVHLYTSRSAKLGVTLTHPNKGDRPRVIIWQNRAYLQDLSNEDSPDYYATDAHWFW